MKTESKFRITVAVFQHIHMISYALYSSDGDVLVHVLFVVDPQVY
jgi:hypothetical protein